MLGQACTHCTKRELILVRRVQECLQMGDTCTLEDAVSSRRLLNSSKNKRHQALPPRIACPVLPTRDDWSGATREVVWNPPISEGHPAGPGEIIADVMRRVERDIDLEEPRESD